MDPLSQGSLGATLAQSWNRSPEKTKAATWLGCFAGLAPDLDILIFSPSDPLLFLEYHRQFTHSLLFIPVGALIVATATHRWLSKELCFKESYFYCLLGYATHGLLDACTTYGTQLFWPFSDARIAWNNVSIIDPAFTFPILALLVTGLMSKQPWFGRIAIIWGISYLMFGVIQRDRAVAAGYELAESRGHNPVRLEAKPGFANLILWKVVYETRERFHVDAIRVGGSGEVRVCAGESAVKLDVARHFPWLDPSSQQARDIERFRWFSNSYLAMDKQVPDRIIDVRYSVVPNEIEGLWGIDVIKGRSIEAHVEWKSLRRSSAEQTRRWWQMLWDQDRRNCGPRNP